MSIDYNCFVRDQWDLLLSMINTHPFMKISDQCVKCECGWGNKKTEKCDNPIHKEKNG